MMKRRIAAIILVLILFTIVLIISPHLICHEDPERHRTECLVCRFSVEKEYTAVCLLVFTAGFALPDSAGRRFLNISLENQLIQDWTPICLKTKLLN